MSGTQFQRGVRLGTVQNVAYTGTAGTISNATAAYPQLIRVICSTAAYIAITAAGTAATTNDVLMGAGIAEYFIVNGAVKVSAIQVASGGVLSVTECG